MGRCVAVGARSLRPPDDEGDGFTTLVTELASTQIRRHEVPGGLVVHEYQRAAQPPRAIGETAGHRVLRRYGTLHVGREQVTGSTQHALLTTGPP
jgi:hypothetical protein